MRHAPPRRPGFYYEPLFATPAKVLAPLAPFVPPVGISADEAEKLRREYEEGPKNPDYLVWGSAIWVEPNALQIPDEQGECHDGAGILCRFSKMNGSNAKAPTSEAMARRVVECVNALRGIANPEAFMADVVATLANLSTLAVDDDAAFLRVVAALAASGRASALRC